MQQRFRCAAPIETLLDVQREITIILASARSLRSAAPRILKELVKRLGWDWGAFWRVQGRQRELVCREIYRRDTEALVRFEESSRAARIAPGEEVVGRVWAGGVFMNEEDFGGQVPSAWGPRYAIGCAEGLCAAICFPIVSGRQIIGVMELAGLLPRAADTAMVQLLVSISCQIGQFVDRKRAFDEIARHDREVMRQKAFADQMMQMVPAGIAFIDRQMRVRWANPHLARILKRPHGAIAGRYLREIFADGRICRMARRVLHTGGTERLANLQPGWSGEGTGMVCDVAVSSVSPPERDRQPDGLFVFLLDVTERAQAERLRDQQVAEIEKIDRLKTDFLNATSHELRTPLSIILGYAEFLEDGIGGPLTDEQGKFVGAIAEAGQALRLLVDDMLDFARIEAGQFVLEKRVADLGQIIRGVVAHTAGHAAYAEVPVRLEVPEEPVRLAMDTFRIGRVIRNLVTNGIKFNRPGGEVVVALSATARSARVEVRDTGIGIPGEHLERIFDKFYQVDSTATRQRGGAGLGLSVARALVQAHRGKIGVTSEVGAGSTFWFSLPRTDPLGPD